jgi:3-oxoadipate CoA-transferase alpha subunit
MDKVMHSMGQAMAGIADGSVVLLGGFGPSGSPIQLMQALLETDAKDLTVVSNNAGGGPIGLSQLIEAGKVRKLICSFARSLDPKNPSAAAFEKRYRAGEIELELVPQGTLAERLRAAGAGMGPFFTPTAFGTRLAEGKETRVINGRGYVLEEPLHADVAFVKAHLADPLGNLTYRYAGRNFAPVMCMAAKLAIAQVDEVVAVGDIAPEQVMTPGIFVQRVIECEYDPVIP